MLKVNRIKGISRSEDENFGFDYELQEGLNLIASDINTRGKSSSILAIYYCLGFEEIVGGKGMKTLTSVYKTVVQDESDNLYSVLESEAWIEISNGTDIVTLFRAGKMVGRNENLISVYYSDMDNIYNPDTYVEDFYVHSQGSATSSKGFHAFLEKFIGFELPLVPTNKDVEYKLYMQLIFSTIFIEQKRGWADLFSAMPVFNIKEAKKRVVEYILGLDSFVNERKRANLKFWESDICSKWSMVVKEVETMCNRDDCRIHGLPIKPKIWTDEIDKQITITTIEQNSEGIDIKLASLENEYNQLIGITPKIVDNYEQLQEELEKTENNISDFEEELKNQRKILNVEKSVIVKLESSLEAIDDDLRNNKDALKLKQMGSEIGINSYKGICPVCHQGIEDSLLPTQSNNHIMSIEENIKHLESQKSMIMFALGGHKSNRDLAEENIQSLSGRIFTLRRLAKTVRNDLYSVDDNLSEAVIYRRIQLENRIQQLNTLKEFYSKKRLELLRLSTDWKHYLKEKSELPQRNFSESDKTKIETLENHFKNYLKKFNYKSVSNYNSIRISMDTYLPISEGFDMKFDSSASDNIRAIWAYTLALLRTSVDTGGNHPHIVIFDEPAQHSIVTEDVISFFNAILDIPGSTQVILGITLNDDNIRKSIKDFDKNRLNIINVGNRAFQPLLNP